CLYKLSGDYVTQDFSEVFTLCEDAAKKVDASAQSYLGMIYSGNYGIDRDLVIAYVWLNTSIANGNDSAKKLRDVILNSMTSEQIEKAQSMAKIYSEYKDS